MWNPPRFHTSLGGATPHLVIGNREMSRAPFRSPVSSPMSFISLCHSEQKVAVAKNPGSFSAAVSDTSSQLDVASNATCYSPLPMKFSALPKK